MKLNRLPFNTRGSSQCSKLRKYVWDLEEKKKSLFTNVTELKRKDTKREIHTQNKPMKFLEDKRGGLQKLWFCNKKIYKSSI